jgi:hypothetical protein
MSKSEFHKDMEKFARELGWEDPDLFLESYRRGLVSKSKLPRNKFLKYLSRKNQQKDLEERRNREIL